MKSQDAEGPRPAHTTSVARGHSPSGECGALQALMNDGGRVTVGSIGDSPAAAIANSAKGILVALARHEGESWHDLLARLAKTVVQAVVEGRIIAELHL